MAWTKLPISSDYWTPYCTYEDALDVKKSCNGYSEAFACIRIKLQYPLLPSVATHRQSV